jgi:hypothetical protein
VRWKKHVAGMSKREIRSAHKISVRKPERRKRLLNGLGLDEKIILKWNSRKKERYRLYLAGRGQGPISGSCETVSKFPNSLKGGEFV